MVAIHTGILGSAGFQATQTLACTLAEAAVYEPEGIYTITRTYQGNYALLLDTHLDRLEESARLENIPLQLDRAALRAALRALIALGGYPKGRFRITIPRQNPAQIYLALEPLKPIPPEVRQVGVKTALIAAQRHNPAAKTTAWMQERQMATAHLQAEIYESILVNEQGELLEGTSSNFYAILNGRLRTAEVGILNGVSRRVLLASIGDCVGLECRPITAADIKHLSEAFLTSSSRGVIPIIEIDGQKIGEAQRGPITLELQQRYDAWTAAHLETI